MTADSEVIERFQALCEAAPQTELQLNMAECRLDPGGCLVAMPDGLRRRYLEGTWDTLSWLLEAEVVPPT